MSEAARTESAPCPLGCSAGDVLVLTAHDRLHGLPGEWRVVRCLGCGLMRTNPRPTRQAIGAFYPDDYQPFHDTRVPAEPRRYDLEPSWRDSLHRAVPALTPGRLLEVGCGSGSFLHAMAARGWKVRGLEPSPEAAAAARAAGYDVVSAQLEAAGDLEGPYHLIAGWMVAEHLHEPVTALTRLRRASVDGAWLAISVPDAGSWEFAAFGDAWYALQVPTHLFHYTRETLQLVLARAGWRLKRVMWQRDAKNLFHSLRYRCADRGWEGGAAWLGEAALGRRIPRVRAALGQVLGRLRASGRMTAWARAA